MFLNLILFSLFLYHFNCLKKFNIDSQGGNVIAMKLNAPKGDCSSIAITDIGTFIKYKSDSSIISVSKNFPNLNGPNSPYKKSFICQYNDNNIILTRDNNVYRIALNGTGDIISCSPSVIDGISPSTDSIFSLQCNSYAEKYIITYSIGSNFYIYDGANNIISFDNSGYDEQIKYSSCFFYDDSYILCINVLSKKTKYIYYKLSDVSIKYEGELISGNSHENEDAIIKYWSNDEILMCIKSKISDIDLYCYMLKASKNDDEININIIGSSFPIIEKVKDGLNSCEIEKLSTHLYISICLSYYYRTTYYLSIFNYDDSNGFTKYNYNSVVYINLPFPLLGISLISITSFDHDSLGIFFRDIDSDSMIFMFYLKCVQTGQTFDKAPKNGEDQTVCFDIDDTTSTDLNGYNYDECTHSFIQIPVGYSKYERDQFCKIKKIECASNYILDDNYNEGTYKCWKNNPVNSNEYYYYEAPTDPSASRGLFKKCYRSCLTCSQGGDDTDNNCDSCDVNNGFYPLITDSQAQCHHKDEPIDRYFFDSNQNKFFKCRKECLTCKELSTILDNEETNQDKDTKCLKCDIQNDYWPQVDKPTNCIKNDPSPNIIAGYFASESYKTWEKCFPGCKYCKELGEGIYDTKCFNLNNDNSYCLSGYSPIEGEEESTGNKNCYKNDERYNYYYFDITDNKFKKCNEACLQCDELGNDQDNTLCLKCDILHNYYPNEDDTSKCYKYDISTYSTLEFPKHYYFDPNTKKYRKCQEGCLYCKAQIYPNENDTQCYNKCDTEKFYYPLDNADGDNLKCYLETKIGYYKEPTSPGESYQMKKCPNQCWSCALVEGTPSSTVKCTECNNDLGFYELEGGSSDETYKDCRTIRAENLLSPGTNDLLAPLNTVLIYNKFQYCDNACTKCTALSSGSKNTHCLAKQCNNGYSYILNYEDICYPQDPASKNLENLPYHFLYVNSNLNEKYYKPCYETCETCSTSGNKQNNNCTSCRAGYIKHPNTNIYPNNCVFNCLSINNYFYLDEDNNDEYTCVDKCPETYPYLLESKKQCLKSCSYSEEYKYSRDWICLNHCPYGTSPDNNGECQIISENCIRSNLETKIILNDISNKDINEFAANYCHDYSFTSQQVTVIDNKLNEFTIYIYKSRDCLNSFITDKYFPDLSVCFSDLKKYYKISKNHDLIVLSMNIQKDSNIRVEYKIYNSITCEELDLSQCSQPNVYTEVKMTNNYIFQDEYIEKAKQMYEKGIIVYNRNDSFFTDICYQFTSSDDKDIILEDRVQLYYTNIDNMCERNCYKDVDFENRIIKCRCELKTKFMQEETEDNKEYGSGIGSVSIEVVKCAKKAFLWNYFRKNIGSYTALISIVAEFPVIFFFFKLGLTQVKVYLIPFMGGNPPKHSIANKNNNQNNNKGEIDNNINNNEMIDPSNQIKEEIISNSKSENEEKDSYDSLIEKKRKYKKKNYDIYKEIKDHDDLNDVELFDAISFDKRSFWRFYWEELQRTQTIIYTFFFYTPLTPKYFKILLFIFNTILCFEFNAFFYFKNYISVKFFSPNHDFSWYVDHIFDRIIVVCVCTVFFNLLIRVLTSSKTKIQMWIKREKDPEKFNKEITYMIKRMYINYIVFICIQGVFMFFFWIYLSCFCICYKNNEVEWFVTSLICFAIIQIWYFISTFIVTCLRFLGIKFGMESCYNVSMCLAYD